LRDELVHHVGVGELLQGREPRDGVEAHRREAGGFDRLQVPAAALDVEDRLRAAEAVALADLDRGVAAAVQDERLVAPQKPRRVYALPEIVGKSVGFGVEPEILHAYDGEGYVLYGAR
jgi:hypothetical protein